MNKMKFKRQFTKRIMTRFHMSSILLAVMLSGLLFSKLLLIVGLNNMVIRFIIVLFFAYLCFFILMKLWLMYLTRPYRRKNNGDFGDVTDLASYSPDCKTSESSSPTIFGGGESGGGGASGSWEPDDDISTTVASESATLAKEPVAETAAEAVGETASGIADESGLLLLPLIVLLLIIFGGSAYLIYEAPMIISEAAFEVVLATSLIKKSRTMDSPDWVGSVFRATWPAFAFTLVVTLILGLFLLSYCPKATKLTEVVTLCL